MTATTTKPPIGLSTLDRQLYEHLRHHVDSEGGMIGLYESLAAAGHPYVAFLAGLIGEDEARHHRLFEQWMESIAASSRGETSEAVPALTRAPASLETFALVERLIAFEKADLSVAKALRKEITDLRDTTVWGALIETVIADTNKHLAILKFIKRHLRSGA